MSKENQEHFQIMSTVAAQAHMKSLDAKTLTTCFHNNIDMFLIWIKSNVIIIDLFHLVERNNY